MALIDTDNLSYVAKNYENEIKNTAKKLYSEDTVNTTLNEVNAKLDKLITELNEKYNFTQKKVYETGGVEDFIKSSHKDIDAISIDSKDFVSDEIKNTISHPSVNAFKTDRSTTGYKMYDFINKSIVLDKNTLTIKFNGENLDSTDKVHTFRINLSDTESLKIVEFAITYRQHPNIVTVVDNESYKEPTVQIVRVIKGKFFIIRHDPVENPQQIIVKAIIENSDNTSNLIDENIIDVKSSKTNKETISQNGIGPEFDLYFKVSSDNTIDICIGKIIPYKWMIEKNYINTESTNTNAFELIESNITGISIDKVLYSESLNKFFVIDNSDKKIYITSDKKLNPSNMTIFDKIAYSSNISLYNAGTLTFINNGLTTLVFSNDITISQDLGYNVRDAKKLSTGEIIIDVNGDKLCVFNPTNYTTLDLVSYKVATNKSGFDKATKFIEYEPGNIIMFTATDLNIYYQSVKYNMTDGVYATSVFKSVSNVYSITKAIGWDAESAIIDAVKTIDNGVSVIVSYKKASGKFTNIVNFNGLTYTGTDIEFTTIKLLDYFNTTTRTTESFTKYIQSVKHTSLFDFGITDDNKLVVFDNMYIYDAITFTEEYEDVKTTDSNGTVVIEHRKLGYSTKNSLLYMSPESNESEYYNSDSIFLCNVFDVVETKSGIYIYDKHGVYELFNNKNLKTRFYSEDGKITTSISNVGNLYGIIICKSDNMTSVFYHSYDVYDSTENKLRYKYTDLYNGKWQTFKTANDTYDSTLKIIEFSGVLYVSIIDRMSSMYNTNGLHNITYKTDIPYSEIDPYISHPYDFNINTQTITKNVPITKFVFTVNKYGITNYHGFETLEDVKNISDINSIKSFILIHKPSDGLTFDDYRTAILQKIKEESLEDDNISEKQKNYIVNSEDASKQKRLIYLNSNSITSNSNELQKDHFERFSNVIFEHGINSSNNYYVNIYKSVSDYEENSNKISTISAEEIISIKNINEMFLFVLTKTTSKSNTYHVYYITQKKC